MKILLGLKDRIKILKFFSAGIVILMVLPLIMLPVFFVCPSTIYAQESDDIIIKEINFDDYPKVEIYINFKEGSELEYMDLKQEDFVVLENGESVKNLSVKGLDEIPDPIGVVLLIDASGSMEGEPIDDAINAASLFINEMRSIDRIAVVSFADDVAVHSDFTSNHQELQSSISEIKAGGETSLFDGIYAACELFNSEENIKHRYIIVLSDGADTVSKHNPDEVIEKALREGISMYSIALLSPEFNPASIKNISESTGGVMLSTADSRELKELYKKISKKIINQYRISYISSWPAAENIEISINIEKTEISSSTALNYENPYYSPPPKKIALDSKNYLSIALFSMPWVMPALLAIVFVAIVMLVYSITLFIPARRVTLRDRTKPYGFKTEGEIAAERIKAEEGERKGFIRWILEIVTKSASRRGFIEFFDSRLARAGIKMKASEFITLHLLLVLIICLLVNFFSKNILLTIVFMIVTIILPFFILNVRESNRLKNFHAQLPDALQLISGSLKAGYSFNQAMSMVVEESKPPLSEEFRRILSEIRMGIPDKEALENASERINSEYFNWVVMALNVQREVGGNLAELMETIGDTIRERDRVMNRIKALTSEGRLSAIILILLPFVVGLLLVIFNREYISLMYTTKLGLLILLFSGIMMIIGIIWILKIIQIKY